MGEMKFYSICTNPGRRKKYTWAFPTFGFPTDKISCKICGRSWNSFANILKEHRPFPITFTNNYFADFISCEGYDLVNQRFKDFMAEHQIRSPKFVEMPIVTKSQLSESDLKERRDKGFDIKRFHDETPTYYLLDAEVGAELHPDTDVFWRDFGPDVCTYCGYGVGYRRKSYLAPEYIQRNSWNGNDIFKVKEFDCLYCTEKFKTLCEQAKITGIEFDEIISK